MITSEVNIRERWCEHFKSVVNTITNEDDEILSYICSKIGVILNAQEFTTFGLSNKLVVSRSPNMKKEARRIGGPYSNIPWSFATV